MSTPEQQAVSVFATPIGSSDPWTWLQQVAEGVGVPTSQQKLGLPANAVGEIVDGMATSRQVHYSYS